LCWTLAKGRIGGHGATRHETYQVYQTAKGRFALYVRSGPSWWYSQPDAGDWEEWSKIDWSERGEYLLEVYETLDELKARLPEELYTAVAQALQEEPVEVLDI
jgi:EXLDI family protein